MFFGTNWSKEVLTSLAKDVNKKRWASNWIRQIPRRCRNKLCSPLNGLRRRRRLGRIEWFCHNQLLAIKSLLFLYFLRKSCFWVIILINCSVLRTFFQHIFFFGYFLNNITVFSTFFSEHPTLSTFYGNLKELRRKREIWERQVGLPQPIALHQRIKYCIGHFFLGSVFLASSVGQ